MDHVTVLGVRHDASRQHACRLPIRLVCGDPLRRVAKPSASISACWCPMLCIRKENHKKLVNACYPDKKALANAAPEFRPKSNELGRLVYYAQSKPAKLSKVGRYLIVRAAAESRASLRSNTTKTKALFMVTLGILKELLASCGTGHAYLAPAVQTVLICALSVAAPRGSNPSTWDMDICERVAVSYALYVQSMPASEVDTDEGMTNAVFQVLSEMQRLGQGKVTEQARLVWMSGVDGLTRSPALTTSAFPRFLSLVLPNLLDIVSPSHVPLEKTGDLSQDVDAGMPPLQISLSNAVPEYTTSAALKLIWNMLHRSDATQLRIFVMNTLAYLDGECQRPSTWEDNEWSLWILAVLVQWSLPTSRYIVPHTLVQSLTMTKNASNLRKTRLLQTMHVILEKRTDIVGLNMTDLLDGHVYFLLSHVQANPYDLTTVQATIDAICHLANYTVYSDQLDDFVEQFTPHMLRVLQDPNLSDETKTHSVNALLACVQALVRSHTQSHVPLRTWSSTEALLLSSIPAVRVLYLHTLLVYLQTEAWLIEQGMAKREPVSECISFLHALASHMHRLAMQGLSDTTRSSTPSDFALMNSVVHMIFQVAPTAGVLAFVPPLLSIAQETSAPVVSNAAFVHHTLTCRWFVGAAFAQLSHIWQQQSILDYLHVHHLPTLRDMAPMSPDLSESYDPSPLEILPFGSGFYSEAPACAWDAPFLIRALSSNEALQKLAHVNAKSLQSWFQRQWTVSSGASDAATSARPAFVRTMTSQGLARAPPMSPSDENSIDVRTLRNALSQPSAEDGKMSTLLRQESCKSPVRSPMPLSSAPSTPMASQQDGRVKPLNDARTGSVSAVLDRYTSGRSKRLPAFDQPPTTPTSARDVPLSISSRLPRSPAAFATSP